MYAFVRIFIVAASYAFGYHDIGADGKSYEQVHQYGYDRSVAAYRSHGVFSRELADDHSVCRIEKLLEYTGDRKRYCESEDLVPQ